MRSAISAASAKEVAVALSGWSRPSFSTTSRNSSRSSARAMLPGEVPMMGAPAASRRWARFSGVCPPNCTMTPFGFTRSMMFITSSKVTGSKKRRSDVS